MLMISNVKYYLKNVLLNSVAASTFTPPILRKSIYKAMGFQIGRGSSIFPQCFCGTDGTVRLGIGSFVNCRCFLDLSDDIIIGNNVSIGFECKFITSSHEVGFSTKRADCGIHNKIIIEDGCWLGANVTVMPGVKIASGCIIGANSLVTKDTEKDGLYVGSPAKRIKELK